MKILVDTNVILDVLCNRSQFVEASSEIWKLCEVEQLEGYISALSIPNIVYILRKELDNQRTRRIIDQITMIFKLVDLTAYDIKKAAEMDFEDYEDTLQMCQAGRIKADYIVTRNLRDFVNSGVTALEPAEIIEVLKNDK